MPRGHRQTLVEAVLLANFRADRQGPLLLSEPLPPELPVEGGAGAREAWEALVAAQGRYRDLGAPDPWGFSVLVRRLHRAVGAGEVSPMERFHVLEALTWGPWRITGPGGEPVGTASHTDEELREHWQGWARFEPPSLHRDEWGEADWAVQFEKGLDAVEAFHAAATERERQRPGPREVASRVRRGG